MKKILYFVRKENHSKKLTEVIEVGDTVLHKVEIDIPEGIDVEGFFEKVSEIINVVLLLPPQAEDEEFIKIKYLLATPLRSLGFSARTRNNCESRGIKNLADLVKLQLAFQNFGKISLNEIEILLEKSNLKSGMDVSRYGF